MDKTKEKREKGIYRRSHVKHFTLIEWLNSLTVPSVVAICSNLPYDGSAGEKPKKQLPKRKKRGSRHLRLFEENVRKTKKTKVCEY